MPCLPVLAAVALLAVAGCGALDCTDVGCDSGLTLDAIDLAYAPRDVRAVRVCVEDRCELIRREHSVGLGGPPLDHGVRKAREVTVTAELLARDDRVVRRSRRRLGLKVVYPNGEACGGGCVVGSLRLDRRGELLPEGEAPATGFAVLHRGRILRPGAAITTEGPGEMLVIDAAQGTERVTVTMRGGRVEANRFGGAQRYIVNLPRARGRARIDAGGDRLTLRVRSADGR